MASSIVKSAIVVFALTATVSAVPTSSYPDKCGDMVCPSDKPLCCGVYYNGGIGLECVAATTCPPIQYPTTTTTPPVTAAAKEARAPAATFGPKCGDSFFCKPGQVCCTLYTCADTPDQCPK